MSGLGLPAYRCLCLSSPLSWSQRSSDLSYCIHHDSGYSPGMHVIPARHFGELIMIDRAGKESKRRGGSTTSLGGPKSTSGMTRDVWSLVHVTHLRGSVVFFHFYGSRFSEMGIALN